jgi:hypothetical protein
METPASGMQNYLRRNSLYKVTPYSDDLANTWNDFVKESGNDCFLFQREYMDYHRDRFLDSSVIVSKDDKWIALLPSNISDDKKTVYSHQGLTFGGLVVQPGLRLSESLEVFQSVFAFYLEQGAEKLIYKSIPTCFRTYRSDYDSYSLFLKDAVLIRRDTNFVIPPDQELSYQERRRRMIKKAIKHQFVVKKTEDYDVFWQKILIPNLMTKHNVRPVHSETEINILKSRFPENIQFFGTYDGERLIAGTVLYRYATYDHSQYISSSDEGRDMGALDLLFDELIKNARSEKKLFSFGITNEQGGRFLNRGLTDWKEGFGSIVVPQDFWLIKLNNPIISKN